MFFLPLLRVLVRSGAPEDLNCAIDAVMSFRIATNMMAGLKLEVLCAMRSMVDGI